MICGVFIYHKMSKQLHVGNQQFFRQYAPDSELPLESRIFTTEYEQGNRQRGDAALPADFSSALNFAISMNNELYFLRSLHLRMPVTARFIDEFGNSEPGRGQFLRTEE